MAYIEHNQNGRSYSAPVEARPLCDNITMTGYDIGQFYFDKWSGRYAGIYDGRYLWITNGNTNQVLKPITRLDVRTGAHDYFSMEDGVNGNTGLSDVSSGSLSGVFDGTYVWIIPAHSGKPIVRLDPKTASMTGFPAENGVNGTTGLPDTYSIYGATYDGRYIWLACSDCIVRLDTTTAALTGCQVPGRYSGVVFDGSYIWAIPYNQSYSIFRIDPKWLFATEFPLSGENMGNTTSSVSLYYSGIFVENKIWLAPLRPDRVAALDIATGLYTFYPMDEGVNGNHNMGNAPTLSAGRFTSAAFDGKHIWMFPEYADRLVRLDPHTGSMRGYEISGFNLGELSNDLEGCDLSFDGKNMWSIPALSRNRLIKISPDAIIHGVAEEYLTASGEVIKLPSLTWVDDGEAYSKTAPEIPGYTCIGHKIDGGELQSSTTAIIDSVQSDRDVTFIYSEEDPATFATIIHEYRTEDGTVIRPDTAHTAPIGQDYTATAPTISAYTYQGYRIDGGALQAGTTPTIPNVQGSHTITFVYKKHEGGTDPGGDGCCCCCCKPIVNFYGDINVGGVSIENLNLFGCGSDCCDIDCK